VPSGTAFYQNLDLIIIIIIIVIIIIVIIIIIRFVHSTWSQGQLEGWQRLIKRIQVSWIKNSHRLQKDVTVSYVKKRRLVRLISVCIHGSHKEV